MQIETAKLRLHGVHKIIPEMTEQEWQPFLNDIKERGILEPLKVLDTTILDGRMRYKAAQKLVMESVPIEKVELKGDSSTIYAIKAALLRRHLKDCQREALAVELEPTIAKEAKKRMEQAAGQAQGVKKSPVAKRPQEKSRDEVAEIFSVSARNVQRAKAVKRADPELFRDIKVGKIVTGKAYKKIKEEEKRRQRQEFIADSKSISEVIVGDFRQLGDRIETNSIDLIFTDPPYNVDSLGLYEDLAAFANQMLRPGGLCLAYCGNVVIPQVYEAMGKSLQYMWTFAIRHTGGEARFRKFHIRNAWKPIICFYKPPLDVWWEWFSDFTSGGKEKSGHEWQQAEAEAAYYIKFLCPSGGIVLDPLCGTGTTLKAAKNLGLRYIGYEINPTTAAYASKRLSE